MANISLIFIPLCIYAFCTMTLQLLWSKSGDYFPSPWIWDDCVNKIGPRVCNQYSAVPVTGLKNPCILFLFSWPLLPPYKQTQSRLLADVVHGLVIYLIILADSECPDVRVEAIPFQPGTSWSVNWLQIHKWTQSGLFILGSDQQNYLPYPSIYRKQ